MRQGANKRQGHATSLFKKLSLQHLNITVFTFWGDKFPSKTKSYIRAQIGQHAVVAIGVEVEVGGISTL